MKIKKLEEVDRCFVCGGTNLTPMSRVPILDLLTDEDIMRDVIFCTDCETSHYMDRDVLQFEFSYKIGQQYSKIKERQE